MSVSFCHIWYYFTVCFSLLLLPISCEWQEHKAALFIFGDSLFDAGTNNYFNTTIRSNFIPYGESYFEHPTGRFSDGRVIPDFIAEYAGLPLIPPYPQPNYQFNGGANFASAGAGALAETYAGFVLSLKTQLKHFKRLKKQLNKEAGDEKTNIVISQAVYLFSIGSNDYLSPAFSNSSFFRSYSHEDYVAMVIGNLTTVIRRIHRKGGRKFGFLSIGPIGCIPSIIISKKNGACSDELNGLAKIHDAALSRTLRELQSELDGFTYSNFDFYNVALQRIIHPSKYGFKEGKTACCGSGAYRGSPTCGQRTTEKKLYELCKDPSQNVFWDASHPSERASQQFAELMWNGSHRVVEPGNLKALFQA